jgi:hypothetical protein
MSKNYVPAGGELSNAIAKALKEVRNAAEMFQVGYSLTKRILLSVTRILSF